MINLDRLETILAAFGKLTIGLVGDLYLDRYLEIEPGQPELSVETGLEAYQIARVRNSPGALGTIMNNLAALGAGRLVPVTVVGDDGHGYDLLKALEQLPVDASHVLRSPDRLTPTYTKPIRREADGTWRELNRLDVRSRAALPEPAQSWLAEHLREVFLKTDGLIVQDQISEEGWGVVNAPTRRLLAELAREHPEKLMFIDSRAHIDRFTFGVLKPNRSECLATAELPGDEVPGDDEASLKRAVARLAERTTSAVFCTLGEHGMLVAQPDGRSTRVPAYPVDGPIDIVGAGDSATSGIVASLLAGASHVEAAAVGNLAASVTVAQLGTTGTASPEQVLARWRQTH